MDAGVVRGWRAQTGGQEGEGTGVHQWTQGAWTAVPEGGDWDGGQGIRAQIKAVLL